ncbi:Scp-like extracellular protein, partial [Globisporangium splendens]
MQPSTKSFLLLSVLAAAAMHTSTASYKTGSQGRVMWDNDCDFYGQDTYSVRAIPDVCGDICANDGGCTHWTWTNYNGGTCWFKNGSSATKNTYYGAGCGYVIGRFGSSNSGQQQTVTVNNGLNAVESQTMLNSINAYRNQNGLASLVANAKLHAAANVHSQDQANRCTMTHDGSDGSKAWDRMAAQGYQWTNAAENVAAGQTSVESVMTSWWNSAGHRANILNAEVRDVGFAKAVNNGCGNYKTYWTQDFGKSS